MSTLKEKAEQILQEKENKIISDNFSRNLEIFGVKGDIMEYTAGSGPLSENIDLDGTVDSLQYRLNGDFLLRDGAFLDKSFTDIANYLDITPDKIKKGVEILGVTGTYVGGDKLPDGSFPDEIVVNQSDGRFEVNTGMPFDGYDISFALLKYTESSGSTSTDIDSVYYNYSSADSMGNMVVYGILRNKSVFDEFDTVSLRIIITDEDYLSPKYPKYVIIPMRLDVE